MRRRNSIKSLEIIPSLTIFFHNFSGSISNIDGAEYNCNKTTVRKVISGVVGAASSVTSIQVANLLRLFRIPQIRMKSVGLDKSNAGTEINRRQKEEFRLSGMVGVRHDGDRESGNRWDISENR
ncbi:hypothetical protein PV325_003224 [Microctonus aethiopoides]|nr:hypothetical protein PV325_003224 [Microctonus aethiopoides]